VETGDIFIVAKNELVSLIKSSLKLEKINYLIEPDSKNTGPAILFSLLSLKRMGFADDNVVVFLPADHFISDEERFKKYISQVAGYAFNSSKIIILGVQPRQPSSKYGYVQINLGGKNCIDSICYDVVKFHEKPTIEIAKEYLKRNDMFWNMGIFVARLDVFIAQYEKYCSDLFSQLNQFVSDTADYSNVPNISIDYALLEKSNDVALFPVDLEWYDVGDLNNFIELDNQEKNVVNIDATGNMTNVRNKKVVFIEVKDLCFVETEDMIIISKKRSLAKIKRLRQRSDL